jgi:hypothetical protein
MFWIGFATGAVVIIAAFFIVFSYWVGWIDKVVNKIFKP